MANKNIKLTKIVCVVWPTYVRPWLAHFGIIICVIYVVLVLLPSSPHFGFKNRQKLKQKTLFVMLAHNLHIKKPFVRNIIISSFGW